MNPAIIDVLCKVEFGLPADDAAVSDVQRVLNVRLPNDYLQLLKIGNGGEGFIGEQYVIFWRIEDLILLNSSYEVRRYAPGLLIFGSSGGGEAYGYDMRGECWEIVSIPFVGMAWDLAEPAGKTIQDFLQYLLTGRAP